MYLKNLSNFVITYSWYQTLTQPRKWVWIFLYGGVLKLNAKYIPNFLGRGARGNVFG
jgi:hypothetical protein